MPTRYQRTDEEARRARRRLAEVASDLRDARRAAGLSQRVVASAIGCSRQLIGHLEAGRVRDPRLVLLARYGATVGLAIRLHAYPGGAPLRDAGQLALFARLQRHIGPLWVVRPEAPVAAGDRRAFDAVLVAGSDRVAVECVTRFTDVQAQVRSMLHKMEDGRIPCLVLVLADTRWNRAAVDAAAPMLDSVFPLRRRAVFAALRSGKRPTANGLLLV